MILILGKEARKKELKKNKKQRQMVRQAVLKNKDPLQLIEEMEQIDEMGENFAKHSRSSAVILSYFRVQCSATVTVKREGTQRKAKEAEGDIRPSHETNARRRTGTMERVQA